MTRIHDNEVNNISECNLLHDILNPNKSNKNINIHYSPILHGCINTRKVKVKSKRFLILLDSGCSSAIVIGRIFEKPQPKKYAVM